MTSIPRVIPLLLALLTAAVRAGDAIDAHAAWSTTEPTTADRLTLTVTVRTDPALTPEPWRETTAQALTDAGFTVITSTATAPALDGLGLIERAASFVVEPFLAGRYAPPPVTISATGPADEHRSVTLTIPEMTVRSLLPEDEPVQVPGMPAPDLGGDLALGTFRPVPEPPSTGPGAMKAVLIAGLLVIAAGVLLVGLGLRRNNHRHDGSDPVETLRRIAPSVRTPNDLAPVDRVVRLAASRFDAWDQLADVVDRLEVARYAPPSDGDRPDPGELAREAAETVARVADASARSGKGAGA